MISKFSNTKQSLELRKEVFISKSIDIHHNSYRYDQVIYINAKTPVKIFCNTCKLYLMQIPSDHLNGCGCHTCGILKKNEKLLKHQIRVGNQFENKSIKIHGQKYNYKDVVYVNAKTKVKLHCNICNCQFLITPNNHLTGYGCAKCGFNHVSSLRRDTAQSAKNKAKSVHKDRYQYLFDTYEGNAKRYKVKCKKCDHIFTPVFGAHLQGLSRCRRCYGSIGQVKILDYLQQKNIKFQWQKRFNQCRYKNPLPFDFYLPELNICIEFDGPQHFKQSYLPSANLFRGGWIDKVDVDQLQIKDKIKDDFCVINNIKLIRIPYTQFKNINKILQYHLTGGA